MRFGACAIFTTPNFPQHRHATFLLTRSEADEPDFSLEIENPELGLLGEMVKKQADDPVGVAFVDDLMFRLFQLHVWGVREDCVGLRHGGARRPPVEAVWDNSCAATSCLNLSMLFLFTADIVINLGVCFLNFWIFKTEKHGR